LPPGWHDKCSSIVERKICKLPIKRKTFLRILKSTQFLRIIKKVTSSMYHFCGCFLPLCTKCMVTVTCKGEILGLNLEVLWLLLSFKTSQRVIYFSEVYSCPWLARLAIDSKAAISRRISQLNCHPSKWSCVIIWSVCIDNWKFNNLNTDW